MANLSQTISIIFDGVDNTATALSSVNKGLGNLADSTQDLTQPLADVTKNLLMFETALVGVAAVFGGAALKESAAFESSMYQIKKATDDTSPSMQQIKEDVEKVGLQFGTNANDVAKATADFMMAGNDYAASARLVETSTRLMIAGDIDAATATKTLNDSLAGFDIPAKDAADAAEKIGDILNKLADVSKSGFTDIADGFAKISPTAKDAGLSMEEAAAVITVITDKGIDGAEAANSLKSGLLQLIGPPKDAAAALEKLGVALKDGNGEQRLAGDILKDLAVKYKDLGANQKLSTAETIFGKDQAGKMNIVLRDWEQAQGYVTTALQASGSMMKEVDGKLQLLETHTAQAKEAWRQFLTALGDKIKNGATVNDLVDSFQRLGVALKDALGAGNLDPIFKPLQAAFAGLTQLVDDVAKNLPAALGQIDWSKFKDSIADLADSFDSIFDGIDLSTPEGLAEVIQLVVDAGAGLIKVTSGIIDGLKPLFDIVGLLVKGFAELDPETQKAIGLFLGLGTTVNVLSGYVSGFSGTIKTITDLLGSGGGLIGALSKLGPAALAAGVAFAAFKIGQWAAEVTGFNAATDKLIEGFDGIPDAAKPADAAIKEAGVTLKELGNTTDEAGKRLTNFNESVESGELVWDKLSQSWVSGLGKISASTGIAIKDWDEFNKLVAAGTIFQSKITGEWEKAGTASSALVKTTGDLIDVTKELNPELLQQMETMKLSWDGTLGYAKGTGEAAKATEGMSNIVRDSRGNIISYTLGMEDAKKATEDTAKAQEAAGKTTKQLAEETEKFALEWEQLASQQRIAIFEASATIAVAQIEADAGRAVAAMAMLSASFESTGTVLQTLFDIWSGVEDLADKSKVEEWINREYEIREKIAQGQLDMIAAEIKRMEAQTRLLEAGGVELKITSAGLEPALEAFMFAVIDKVRVNVAGSYEEFLLGCGGA